MELAVPAAAGARPSARPNQTPKREAEKVATNSAPGPGLDNLPTRWQGSASSKQVVILELQVHQFLHCLVRARLEGGSIEILQGGSEDRHPGVLPSVGVLTRALLITTAVHFAFTFRQSV